MMITRDKIKKILKRKNAFRATVNPSTDKHEKFTFHCSPKTQAVICYESCRRCPTRGKSGFHWLSNSRLVPFSMCGWARFDDYYDYGVAFRINRDCFAGRDAVLYYLDDDCFGELTEDHKKHLQEMKDRIERYSSGLTDIRICESVESETFMFQGSIHDPTRITMIQFRLDQSKIKKTVLLSSKPQPTSKIGEYVFILPRAGEFYIELGEVLHGKRIPLHYDDFCMK